MIRSHTLFRTLTLVGITIFTFVFGAGTIVSGLSAQAESKADTPNQHTALQTNQPKMSFGVNKLKENKLQDKLSLLPTEGNKPLKPQYVSTATDTKTKKSTATETSQEEKPKTETPKELHKKAQRRAQ